MSARWMVAGGCALVLGLAGCSGTGHDELQQWMAEQRSQIKPAVPPIPAPTQFIPQTYTQQGAVEPFSSLKLAQALRRDTGQAAQSAALITPEMSRRKEALESFPLDSMTMVGTLLRQGQQVALVKVDNLLYQVAVGHHMGQNYGRVTRISETELSLREIVQDAAGEWIERTSRLQLQERSK